MKMQYTLLFLTAVWFTSNVGVVNAMEYIIREAECKVVNNNLVKECNMEAGEDDDGMSCISTFLVLGEPLGDNCQVSVTVKKMSGFGGEGMDTGVEMNESVKDLLTKSNAMGKEIKMAANFPDEFPIPASTYQKICYVPSNEMLPKVFPRGNYRFHLTLTCDGNVALKIELDAEVP